MYIIIESSKNPFKEDKAMVQIIAGEKGKGKTKILLDKVNADVATSKGTSSIINNTQYTDSQGDKHQQATFTL